MRLSDRASTVLGVICLGGAALGAIYLGAYFLADLSYPDRRGIIGAVTGLVVGYWLAALPKNEKIRGLERELLLRELADRSR